MCTLIISCLVFIQYYMPTVANWSRSIICSLTWPSNNIHQTHYIMHNTEIKKLIAPTCFLFYIIFHGHATPPNLIIGGSTMDCLQEMTYSSLLYNVFSVATSSLDKFYGQWIITLHYNSVLLAGKWILSNSFNCLYLYVYWAAVKLDTRNSPHIWYWIASYVHVLV